MITMIFYDNKHGHGHSGESGIDHWNTLYTQHKFPTTSSY